MNHHVITWKLVGLWYWKEQPRFYTIYTIFATIFFYILFPLLMFLKLFFSNNMFEIVDIILFLPTAMGGTKAFLIVRKRIEILEVLEMMKKLDEQITNEMFRRKIQLRIRQSQRFIYVLCFVYYTSTVCDYLSALMNSKRILVWVSWYPFDATASLEVYHGILIYQLVATLYMATIIQSIDVFGGSIYCILGGHLEVLSDRMLSLGKRKEALEFRLLGIDGKHQNGDGRKRIRQNLKECESMLNDCINIHHLCVK